MAQALSTKPSSMVRRRPNRSARMPPTGPEAMPPMPHKLTINPALATEKWRAVVR